jgi:hypothetical protein
MGYCPPNTFTFFGLLLKMFYFGIVVTDKLTKEDKIGYCSNPTARHKIWQMRMYE